MPKRTTQDVRREIGAEREALVREVGALRHDVAGVLPYAVGTALALAVLTRSKSARLALKALWWLR